MRNMSFSMTTDQIRNRTKTVTRRLGWKFLKPGDLVCAVEKGMGLKKDEKVKRLAILRIISVRQESLNRMIEDFRYARREVAMEGFMRPDFRAHPSFFIDWFLERNKITSWQPVTRIEFEYVD